MQRLTVLRNPGIFIALLGIALSSCATQEAAPQAEFSDCGNCPTMRALPAGSFLMGTAEADRLIDPRTGKPATNDGPQHRVDITAPFAIGKYEVTVGEFAEFVAATNYETVDRCMEFSKPGSFTISKTTDWGNTGFAQSPDQPVVCVSWFDAAAYAQWLAELTGRPYRLPTEAEWEYAARAGATTPYFWGDDESVACDFANVRSTGADTISKRQVEADKLGFPCDDGAVHSSPVGSYKPNNFGLYDVQGNAWEWVADCNHKDYTGAPTDGSAWLEEAGKECRFGIIRGGSFLNLVERSSVTVRAGRPRSGGATNMGFRVALSLNGAAGAAVTAATDGAAWGETTATDAGPGAQLFADNCAACHIRSDNFEGLYGTSRDDLIQAIRDGGNNVMSMPAFGTMLQPAEIAVLADYVRRVNGWD